MSLSAILGLGLDEPFHLASAIFATVHRFGDDGHEETLLGEVNVNVKVKGLLHAIVAVNVCLISLALNLPRGGNSEKDSTHIGLEGNSFTMAAHLDLMNLGTSSMDLPV